MTGASVVPVIFLSDGTTAIIGSDGHPIFDGITPEIVQAVQRTLVADWPYSREMEAAIVDLGYEEYLEKISTMNLSDELRKRYNYVASFIHIKILLLQDLNFSGALNNGQISSLTIALQRYFSEKPTELQDFHKAVALCIRSDIFRIYVDRPSAQNGAIFPSWDTINKKFDSIDNQFNEGIFDSMYYGGLLSAAYTLMNKGHPDLIALPAELDLEPIE